MNSLVFNINRRKRPSEGIICNLSNKKAVGVDLLKNQTLKLIKDILTPFTYVVNQCVE